MKKVAQFIFPTEAGPLVALLEGAGIPVTLGNQHVIGAQPFLSHAVGGLQVLVADEHEAQAHALVAEFQQAGPAHFPKPEPAFLRDHEPYETWCPQCEAYPVYQRKVTAGLQGLAVVLALLTHFGGLFLLSRTLVCARCGHSFKR